jgi:hypothetical protein
MALRDDPMMWLTPLLRPLSSYTAQNGKNSLKQAQYYKKNLCSAMAGTRS